MVRVSRRQVSGECEIPECHTDAHLRLYWRPPHVVLEEGRNLCKPCLCRLLATVTEQRDGLHRFQYDGVEFEAKTADAIKELTAVL